MADKKVSVAWTPNSNDFPEVDADDVFLTFENGDECRLSTVLNWVHRKMKEEKGEEADPSLPFWDEDLQP